MWDKVAAVGVGGMYVSQYVPKMDSTRLKLRKACRAVVLNGMHGESQGNMGWFWSPPDRVGSAGRCYDDELRAACGVHGNAQRIPHKELDLCQAAHLWVPWYKASQVPTLCIFIFKF